MENSTIRQGQRRDPYRGFKFRVLIDGFESAGFKSVDGLSVETEVVEYREGTDGGHVHKLPGLTTFEDLVLERGKSERNDLENMQRLVYDLESGRGQPDPLFRKNCTIELRNYNDRVVKRWQIKHAWINKLSHSTLDASSSEVFIETATMCHEGCSVIL